MTGFKKEGDIGSSRHSPEVSPNAYADRSFLDLEALSTTLPGGEGRSFLDSTSHISPESREEDTSNLSNGKQAQDPEDLTKSRTWDEAVRDMEKALDEPHNTSIDEIPPPFNDDTEDDKQSPDGESQNETGESVELGRFEKSDGNTLRGFEHESYLEDDKVRSIGNDTTTGWPATPKRGNYSIGSDPFTEIEMSLSRFLTSTPAHSMESNRHSFSELENDKVRSIGNDTSTDWPATPKRGDDSIRSDPFTEMGGKLPPRKIEFGEPQSPGGESQNKTEESVELGRFEKSDGNTLRGFEHESSFNMSPSPFLTSTPAHDMKSKRPSFSEFGESMDQSYIKDQESTQDVNKSEDHYRFSLNFEDPDDEKTKDLVLTEEQRNPSQAPGASNEVVAGQNSTSRFEGVDDKSPKLEEVMNGWTHANHTPISEETFYDVENQDRANQAQEGEGGVDYAPFPENQHDEPNQLENQSEANQETLAERYEQNIMQLKEKMLEALNYGVESREHKTFVSYQWGPGYKELFSRLLGGNVVANKAEGSQGTNAERSNLDQNFLKTLYVFYQKYRKQDSSEKGEGAITDALAPIQNATEQFQLRAQFLECCIKYANILGCHDKLEAINAELEKLRAEEQKVESREEQNGGNPESIQEQQNGENVKSIQEQIRDMVAKLNQLKGESSTAILIANRKEHPLKKQVQHTVEGVIVLESLDTEEKALKQHEHVLEKIDEAAIDTETLGTEEEQLAYLEGLLKYVKNVLKGVTSPDQKELTVGPTSPVLKHDATRSRESGNTLNPAFWRPLDDSWNVQDDNEHEQNVGSTEGGYSTEHDKSDKSGEKITWRVLDDDSDDEQDMGSTEGGYSTEPDAGIGEEVAEEFEDISKDFWENTEGERSDEDMRSSKDVEGEEDAGSLTDEGEQLKIPESTEEGLERKETASPQPTRIGEEVAEESEGRRQDSMENPEDERRNTGGHSEGSDGGEESTLRRVVEGSTRIQEEVAEESEGRRQDSIENPEGEIRDTDVPSSKDIEEEVSLEKKKAPVRYSLSPKMLQSPAALISLMYFVSMQYSHWIQPPQQPQAASLSDAIGTKTMRTSLSGSFLENCSVHDSSDWQGFFSSNTGWSYGIIRLENPLNSAPAPAPNLITSLNTTPLNGSEYLRQLSQQPVAVFPTSLEFGQSPDVTQNPLDTEENLSAWSMFSESTSSEVLKEAQKEPRQAVERREEFSPVLGRGAATGMIDDLGRSNHNMTMHVEQQLHIQGIPAASAQSSMDGVIQDALNIEGSLSGSEPLQSKASGEEARSESPIVERREDFSPVFEEAQHEVHSTARRRVTRRSSSQESSMFSQGSSIFDGIPTRSVPENLSSTAFGSTNNSFSWIFDPQHTAENSQNSAANHSIRDAIGVTAATAAVGAAVHSFVQQDTEHQKEEAHPKRKKVNTEASTQSRPTARSAHPRMDAVERRYESDLDVCDALGLEDVRDAAQVMIILLEESSKCKSQEDKQQLASYYETYVRQLSKIQDKNQRGIIESKLKDFRLTSHDALLMFENIASNKGVIHSDNLLFLPFDVLSTMFEAYKNPDRTTIKVDMAKAATCNKTLKEIISMDVKLQMEDVTIDKAGNKRLVEVRKFADRIMKTSVGESRTI